MYEHSTGETFAVPESRNEARALRLPMYDDHSPCPECGKSAKHTLNAVCAYCTTASALAKFQSSPLPRSIRDADRIGSPLYIVPYACRRAGHVGVRRVVDGKCQACHMEREDNRRRGAARRAGERTYTPHHACPECGTRSARRVSDNRCSGCHPEAPQSPRQAAIAAGERWYKPTVPCRHCGSLALRRVDNGQCRACLGRADKDPKSGKTTPDSQLRAAHPDMVISKKMARELGLKVYRTGQPCAKGHRSWRYVSTGTCVDCLRGIHPVLDGR